MTITPIKVSGIKEILGTIPVMLGFHPEDSLVVVGLSGPRLKVGPVARVDLPIGADGVRAMRDAMIRHASHAIVVIYGDNSDVTEADLRSGLGLEVLDVVWTQNIEHDVHSPVAEASALSGRAVLRDRATLRASVEHRPGTGTAQTRRTLAKVTTTIEQRDRFLSDRITVASSEISELIAAAQATSDAEPGAADLCAVLAVIAYRTGDGALGQVSIDRALRINPGHRLAHLALDIMAVGVKPEELDQFFL